MVHRLSSTRPCLCIWYVFAAGDRCNGGSGRDVSNVSYPRSARSAPTSQKLGPARPARPRRTRQAQGQSRRQLRHHRPAPLTSATGPGDHSGVMSENNTRARPTGWTLSVSQAKLDRGVNRGSEGQRQIPARRTAGSIGWMLLSKRGCGDGACADRRPAGRGGPRGGHRHHHRHRPEHRYVAARRPATHLASR